MANRILILGGSSWIGHYLSETLRTAAPDAELFCTYRNGALPTQVTPCHFPLNSPDAMTSLLTSVRPDIVFNLLRGESEQAFASHLALMEWLNRGGGHYVFMSSSNAVDANLGSFHTEDEVSDAQSEYGRYKGRCEQALREVSKRWMACRFAATHGWCNTRHARTQQFFEKLRTEGVVRIPRGVLQNRTFVADLAGMMVAVALKDGQGIIHFGTVDHSEEVDFLRNMAVACGYSREQVLEEGVMPTNMVMIPKRLFEIAGSEWIRHEEDTIRCVAEDGRFRAQA